MNKLRRVLNEVFYGMTIYEMALVHKKDKEAINNLFMLIIFGDLIGLPRLSSCYSMRLLPYTLPVIKIWKRSIVRGKDLTDFEAQDI